MATALQRSEFLLDLLAQPTAPFRETHVIATVSRRLERAGVPFFQDPLGNVVIGVADRRAYAALLAQRDPEPVRIFIAHMDHPGFHGVRWSGEARLQIKWHGGSPMRYVAGAPVWLADAAGWRAGGELTKIRFTGFGLSATRRAIAAAEVRFKPRDLERIRHLPAASLYGGFRFRAPVWCSGRRLYTKAADDLVGVYAVCATAMHLFRKRSKTTRPPFLGLLTRAEEVGFIGAIGHFELGWLTSARRPLACISLETSRTLPGAVIGKGPVVRLGDRRTVFEAGCLQILTDIARGLLPDAHQRRVMDGGVCEATAATAYGLPAVGISVPLGNYHNEGFEGGPDCRHPHGPAPEFVHLEDIHGMVRLCRGLMRPGLPWSDPWKKLQGQLRKRLHAVRTLL